MGIKYWSDYAFYALILQWGVASVFFIYPPLGGISAVDSKASRVSDSLVDRKVVSLIDSERFSENTIFCIKLLVSGVPVFLITIIAGIAT